MERDKRQPDQCRQHYRPVAADAVSRPAPGNTGPELPILISITGKATSAGLSCRFFCRYAANISLIG